MKKIAEQKLQAFTVGTMGKRQLSRKELEEQKKREDEAAAAHAFKEFVETFQEAPSKISKVWVKAGTYDAGSRKEDVRDKGKLYKPSSKMDTETEKPNDYVKMLASENKKDLLLTKKKTQDKKKSNLELFKEELRQIQEEREERHKYKHMAKSMLPSSADQEPNHTEKDSGSFDNGDPNTTNLYLGNLNPKISEQALMELFGKYGPLASIKIMWPRSEEERARCRNCGFVAYMSRKDAERALRSLNGKDVMNYEMKLGWGKSVPIMTHPIYIPPVLVAYTLPPPSSGLPFNAQPHPTDLDNIPLMTSKMYMNDPELKEQMDSVLYKATVKVVIPTERALLMLIHRMVEFVIREGPMFEALIMTREMDNPMYKFLFENESPAHIYYRWKLFSLLQGDTTLEWRTQEFRMFKGGSIWKPPPINFYTQGMPEELLVDEDGMDGNKGNLSVAQRDRLEDLIRHLTPERQKIGDAMIFCIEHADAAEEICECISESLASNGTLVKKKIARIYLISDILHNCSVKVQNASFFRKALEKNLLEIFTNLHNYHKQQESRLKAEGFKSRVMNVFKAWEEWAVYPKEFLTKLQHTFLGIQIVEKQEEELDDENEDEDLDGVPLDGAALLKSAMLKGMTETETRTPVLKHDIYSDEEDIDGMPMDEDIDGVPLDGAVLGTDLEFENGTGKGKTGGSFIPSKWETVDASQIEAQAITTSKWETLDPVAPAPPQISLRDGDNTDEEQGNSKSDQDEARRLRLREIEVKIVQYTDEFESGARQVRVGLTLAEEIAHYRRKLIKKAEKELRQQQQQQQLELQLQQQESKSVEDTDDSDEYEERKAYSKKASKRSPSSEVSRKHKKSRRSPSSEYVREAAAKSSRRSRSPGYTGSRSKRESSSPVRSSKASRHRAVSRSASRSPTRRHHTERSISPSTRSKYELLESPARSASKYDKYEGSATKYDKYESSKYDSRLYEERSSSKYEKYEKYESSSKHERERERDRERDRDREKERDRDKEREREKERDSELRERERERETRDRDRERDRLYASSGSKYEVVSSKYDETESRRYRSPTPSRSSRESYRYATSSRSEKHKKHKY
ncbi:U2 snRNP-associated SURP motif-containing protein [Topomyia yanbarensis]|uniref:U2 snRNP-associated SURP motif-containing protein n=1 Tax=Topomyia yanbarensis TaxID=2498891 RepID=UPI00273B198E|nr:U2 snRNP-associated SURP motif-containing protein [Topomyia yanbarensis]